jgi:hypothetical protein
VSTKLPAAIVIGAPKTGTTTLCAALARAPGIWMYPRKETHFFNHHYEDRGPDWYAGLFADAPEGALVMEGTPDYAMSNHVALALERMRRHLPEARLVYMLRHPIDRLESHYVQMVANMRRVVPIEEAIARWPEIVETSDYARILAQVHAAYPPERVHVLFLEDYRSDARACHARLLRFLGVASDARALDAMEAQEALHRREDQAMDRALLARLRRLRSYDRLNARIPAPVIRIGKRLLRRPLQVESRLPEGLRPALEERLLPGWTALRRDYAPARVSAP